MFSYFGSKTKIVHLYPPPAQGRVIEPFCGSARYSLQYWDRDVWLNDIDPQIVRIWEYLIRATAKDIRSLPEPKPGDDLRDFKQLSNVERELLGFCCGFGRVAPGYTPSPFTYVKRKIASLKEQALRYLPRIRHWKITCLHYSDLPDVEATWFVDPPYQHAKVRYRYDCILDYERLGRWCRSRRGRTMVCEGEGAKWLPFRLLTEQWTQKKRLAEEWYWWRDR